MTRQKGPTYDYKEVVVAYLKFRRWESAHPDLVEFYGRRFHVVSELFGIDPTSFDERDSFDHGLRYAFRCTADDYNQIHMPLSGYLEAPDWLSEIAPPFRTRLRPLVDEQKTITFELLCALFVAIYGEIDIRIDDKVLRRHGVDDRKAPDPIDYW